MFSVVYSAVLKALKELVTAFRNDLVWYKYLHHNFTVRYDTCMLLRSERLFQSELSECMRRLLKESKMDVLYDTYWRKYPLSDEYSDVHNVFSNLFFKPGFHSGIPIVAGEILKIRKTNRARNLFI